MTSRLMEACSDVVNADHLLELKLPQGSALQRLSLNLDGLGAGIASLKPGKDYDVVAEGLLAAISGGRILTSKEIQDAAWCLWQTNPALALVPAALSTVVDGCEQSNRRRAFRALASSYLSSFARDLPGLEEAGASLARQATRWGPPWQSLQAELKIFDPIEGPHRLGLASLEKNSPVVDVLREYGCGAIDAQSGFAKAAADEILLALASDHTFSHEVRLEKVKRFGLKSDGQLQFNDQSALVANALLKPFNGQTPEKGIRDLYLQVLLGLFGDPRLRPGRWNGIRDLEEMIRRWLTEQSLRQFLDIVDRVAVERMWKYRRAFWEAVYRAGLITEAWVVFGFDGARLAKQAYGRDASFARFGAEGTKQVESGHAVLLLRVGRGIVADWSHNGKCNIWSDAEANDAPRLYKAQYHSDDVRISRGAGNLETSELFSVSHMGAEYYSWQIKVAERLYQMTGRRVKQTTYKV